MPHSIPNELSEFITKCEQFSHYETVNTPIENYDAMWILREAHMSTLKLLIDLPYEAMYNEALAAASKFNWEYHRNEDGKGWAALTIHGQGAHVTNAPEYVDGYDRVPFHWTEVADVCPITKQWLEESPYFYEYMRVRFMLVEPGGYVLPHRDVDVSKLGPINIALNNPDNCNFYMEDAGIVPWQPGDIRLMNVGRKHAVWNNSSEPRIHMIVHSNRGKEFQDLVYRSYQQFRQEYKI